MVKTEEVDWTPKGVQERLVVEMPGKTVEAVATASFSEGQLTLTQKITTPLQVVTITHSEDDRGNEYDERVVESTPLADFLNAGGRVVVVLASMPVSVEQAAAELPQLRVYPPATEQPGRARFRLSDMLHGAGDLYGLEDDGSHGTPDDCGGDCRFQWN
jgi:hypothetical protein